MLPLNIAIAATAFLTPPILAQQTNYTIWSSVVLTRTGNRTPEILGDIPTKLTSVGANQAFAAGTFFRNRYLVLKNGTNGISGDGAPLRGLDPSFYSNIDVSATALDQQWNSATATAFLQGFYPAPGGLNSSDLLDLTSSLNNGSYVIGPLNDYQYPRIYTPRLGADPESIYLDAASACMSFGLSEYESLYTATANATREKSKAIYRDVGSRFLGELLPSERFWSFENAYAIYDYLRYKYEHEASAQRQLDELAEGTNKSYLAILKELADEQLYAKFGNASTVSTIPGNFLAGSIFNRLADAVYGTDRYQPLHLLFADYQPFMSLFSLTDLPLQSTDFLGVPNFGASAVFELFSHTNNSTGTIPPQSELFVRFLFRNGTDAGEQLQAYSLFSRSKEQFDMPWLDFVELMSRIRLQGTDNWCSLCKSQESGVPFCAASSNPRSRRSGLSPVVAGIIGAVATLATAALLFGAVMLVGGVRLHRNGGSGRKSDLGGFKGGQKMASDQDLSIPKGGAIVGATVERHGHERTGSWELNQSEPVQNDGEWRSARPSMEQIRAVQPHERV